MSSKRHIRRRSCEGKKRHASRGAAMIHVKSLAKAGLADGQKPYHCRFCGGWHVGHPIGLKVERFRMERRA